MVGHVEACQPLLDVALHGGGSSRWIDRLATALHVRFYREPLALELLDGQLRGPSSGGTRWVLYDHRGFLLNFEHTAARLRYCRWGETGVTLAVSTYEEEQAGVNVTAVMTCYSADKGPDFAGVVSVYVSLNGIEFADTGLTFTYYRSPTISAHTPHGGPVACAHSVLNQDGSAVNAATKRWEPGELRRWRC